MGEYNPSLRSQVPRLNLPSLALWYPEDYEEPDAATSPPPLAASSPHRTSSPLPEEYDAVVDPEADLLSDLDDSDDPDFKLTEDSKRARGKNIDMKVAGTLHHMRTMYHKFSVIKFLSGLFKSEDSDIKKTASMFYSDGAHIKLMDIMWEDQGGAVRASPMVDWVMKRAGEVCAREASHLTNRAKDGPHFEDAERLRLSSKTVNIDVVNEFEVSALGALYDRVTPHFQQLLRAFMTPPPGEDSGKNRNYGRIMITSIALNMRSQITNYHQAMNSLIFWDNRMPKRLVHLLNKFGVCAGYKYQVLAVNTLGDSAVTLARWAANNIYKIIMLPYDNFNWLKRAWETSASHKTQTHDQVSAILVALPPPQGSTAASTTAIPQFKETAGTRHALDPHKALTDIVATKEDQQTLRAHGIIHVQHTLLDNLKGLEDLRQSIPQFTEPKPIPGERTEEYYLPTLDQEQGSTRGNMEVLKHYFGKILAIPKERFENTMFTILGDRLTVARDRAAQDQRALDTSPDAFDHLSSFSMVGGLMHYEMNFIKALASNFWGSKGGTDDVSLGTFHARLPNHPDVNPNTINYYAWLRFLKVVFNSLVLRAGMKSTNTTTIAGLSAHISRDPSRLATIAASIVDASIMPSPSRLEALGIKSLKGDTVNGHAVLLLRDLLTLQEMHDAVKRGHPTRALRMIKFWMPMFYAAGCYNYANECMELLHNMVHDWPKPYAAVAFSGMFFNAHGKPEDFKATDIRVEHLNDRVKERAHGSNASPTLLGNIVPAMGHVQDLTDRVFQEMNVEATNQRHAHVSQQKDVTIALAHLQSKQIFDFSHDTPSPHTVLDLYDHGLKKVGGTQGGHRRHLARHKLRLLQRHTVTQDEHELATDFERELSGVARDSSGTDFTLGTTDEEWSIEKDAESLEDEVY